VWATPAQRTLPVVLSTEAASAVVVRVPLPAALARLRARWDWAAGVGVPPHVTVVFPFLPADRLTPDVRRALVAIAASHRPFDVRFARVERFPTVVYLAPEPSAPFTRLTEAVVDRFPDFPPYGGAFEEVIPHLTITESGDAAFDAIAAQAETALPFSHRVTRLDVLVETAEGRWHGHWRIPLGVRP
jgi:2'-5' RNA ligase